MTQGATLTMAQGNYKNKYSITYQIAPQTLLSISLKGLLHANSWTTEHKQKSQVVLKTSDLEF